MMPLTIPRNGTTYDVSPTITIQLSVEPPPGAVVMVIRNGVDVGAATLQSGLIYAFTDADVVLGPQEYACAIDTDSRRLPGAGSYSIVVAELPGISVTSVIEDLEPPSPAPSPAPAPTPSFKYAWPLTVQGPGSGPFDTENEACQFGLRYKDNDNNGWVTAAFENGMCRMKAGNGYPLNSYNLVVTEVFTPPTPPPGPVFYTPTRHYTTIESTSVDSTQAQLDYYIAYIRRIDAAASGDCRATSAPRIDGNSVYCDTERSNTYTGGSWIPNNNTFLGYTGETCPNGGSLLTYPDGSTTCRIG